MLRHSVLGLVAIALLAASACDTGLSDKLKGKKDEMAKQAKEELTALLDARAKKMIETLPKKLTMPEEGEHPLVAWRMQTINEDPTLAEVTALIKKYEAKNMDEIVVELKEVEDFLTFQKEYYNKKIQLKQFNKKLADYLKFHPDGLMKENAIFDKIFIHARQLYISHKYDEDVQLTSYFRFWKLAFDFPSVEQEKFMNYITRLCDAKLKDFCAGVMWEDRPKSMNIPYLQKLIGMTDELIEGNPEGPFTPALEVLKKDFAARLEGLSVPKEYPVLPASFGEKFYVGSDHIFIGPNGIRLGDLELAPFEEQYDYKKKAVKEARGKLETELRKVLEAMTGTDIFIDLVGFQTAAHVPMTLIESFLEILMQNHVDATMFAARNKGDGTNRKVGHLMILFPEKNTRLKEIEISDDGSVEKKKDQATDAKDFKATIPATLLGKKPHYLGFLGQIGIEIKAPTGYVEVSAKTIDLGPLDGSKAGKAELSVPFDAPEAKDKIKAWMDARKEPVVMLVPKSFDMTQFIRACDLVMVTCKDAEDKECKEKDHRKLPVAIGLY